MDPAAAGTSETREDEAGAGAGAGAVGAPCPAGFAGPLGYWCPDHEGGSGGGEGSSDGSIQMYVMEQDSPTTTLMAATTFTTIPREANILRLLEPEKLILVLDLDHTLLNSTGIHDLSATELANGFTQHTRDDPRMGLFRLDFPHLAMLTKLRPFARGFLQEASDLFEMYVYTLGDRGYAREIVRRLDPDGAYFGGRVISNAESTRRDRKSLDVVAPEGERSAVVILDDTDNVWEEHMDSLILVERYLYFASTCRNLGYPGRSSLAELRVDEREHDGALAVMMGVLRRVHRMFYELLFQGRGHLADVRLVIGELRREVLRGCTLAFSGPAHSRLHQVEMPTTDHHLVWRMAQRLGAVCTAGVGVAVTHVVAIDGYTKKARWALQHGKFLVNPGWITVANVRWSRPDEKAFPVAWGTR